MSEYMFGGGNGKVSTREEARVDRIAKKYGATFVAYCGPECYCGHNCGGGCNHRYWFASANRGEPFDGAMARAVESEVGKIKTK